MSRTPLGSNAEAIEFAAGIEAQWEADRAQRVALYRDAVRRGTDVVHPHPADHDVWDLPVPETVAPAPSQHPDPRGSGPGRSTIEVETAAERDAAAANADLLAEAKRIAAERVSDPADPGPLPELSDEFYAPDAVPVPVEALSPMAGGDTDDEPDPGVDNGIVGHTLTDAQADQLDEMTAEPGFEIVTEYPTTNGRYAIQVITDEPVTIWRNISGRSSGSTVFEPGGVTRFYKVDLGSTVTLRLDDENGRIVHTETIPDD